MTALELTIRRVLQAKNLKVKTLGIALFSVRDTHQENYGSNVKSIEVVLDVQIESFLRSLFLQVPHFPQHEKASEEAENAPEDELDAVIGVKLKLKNNCKVSLCFLDSLLVITEK